MSLLNDTYSEEHRHDCEVRWLAKMPLQKRREYLQLVEQKRNKEARTKIEQGLLDIWNKR